MYSNNILNFQESTTILNACTKIVWKLNECIKYVDNLLVTSDNTSELVHTYESVVSIITEGNFCLRSCTSNYAPLRDQMKHDGSFEGKKSY